MPAAPAAVPTFILRAMSWMNSGKSMVPLPSASTSVIMSCSSASVGFCPSDRITVPSSLVVMVPCREQGQRRVQAHLRDGMQ